MPWKARAVRPDEDLQPLFGREASIVTAIGGAGRSLTVKLSDDTLHYN
jgi:hypothetical protein